MCDSERALEANIAANTKTLAEAYPDGWPTADETTDLREVVRRAAAEMGVSPIGLVLNNGRSIGRAADKQTEPNPHPDNYWLGSGDVVVGTGGPVDKPAVREVLSWAAPVPGPFVETDLRPYMEATRHDLQDLWIEIDREDLVGCRWD